MDLVFPANKYILTVNNRNTKKMASNMFKVNNEDSRMMPHIL